MIMDCGIHLTLEKKMKVRILIALIFILVLFTSCDSFSLQSMPTAEDYIPEVTHTNHPASATPLPLTLTKTPELPTITSTPNPTDTNDEPTHIPTLTPTNKLVLMPSATQALLGVQIGSPVGIPNFTYPELGCQWFGVAGQVLDIDDLPLKDVVVEVGGTLAGHPIFGLAVTGESTAYGPGGYEIKLGDKPIASDGVVWALVYDLDGNAISSPTYFPTYADCDKNLIILNFVQSYKLPSPQVYLPIIVYENTNPR